MPRPDTAARSDAYPRLLGDFGGTRTRFGYQAARDVPLTHISVVDTSFSTDTTPEEVIRLYLAEHGLEMPPYAGFSVAFAYQGEDHIDMPRRRWSFSVQGLRVALGAEYLAFVHDGAAAALGLLPLLPEQAFQIGGRQAAPHKPKIVVGVGTALAVSTLVQGLDGQWFALPSAGGRMSLPAAMTGGDRALIEQLLEDPRNEGQQWAALALSGQGLVRLYEAITRIRPCALRPEDVMRRALGFTDWACVAALSALYSLLGTFAGDFALAMEAGAVYIGGGILPRAGVKRMKESPFRASFNARESKVLSDVPVYLIGAGVMPELLGASVALDRALQH